MTAPSYGEFLALPGIKTIEVEPVYVEWDRGYLAPDVPQFCAETNRRQVGSVLTLTLMDGTVLKFAAPSLVRRVNGDNMG
jgi:hypothetical protein